MIEDRVALVRSFPCFARLNQDQANELISLMDAIHYSPHEKVVTENDVIDSVFFILQGEAEVICAKQHKKKMQQEVIAVLRAGESIGLNDTGFYSTTGRRTATVIAMTDLYLLRLDIKKLNTFLKTYQLETIMINASEQMLRMNFIKQSLPFARMSHERLQWLANRVEKVSVPAGHIIFKEGDKGDHCYLIQNGEVEILVKDEHGNEKQLALLKPPVLFGEATLITGETRNATARVRSDCELLMLSYENLSELLDTEKNVSQMFMTLMVDRSRPIQNKAVTLHHRVSADGQQISILKNTQTNQYFKLSKEGIFIWQQLDGKHTLQDITLALAETYHVFAPDLVAALISKLSRSGFIANLEMIDNIPIQKQPMWVKAISSLRRFLEIRFAIGDVNPFLTNQYQQYIHYLFTPVAQIILALIAVTGFGFFILETHSVLRFFQHKHISLLLLLTLIPLSLVKVFLHELGHAFAVKAFGREVHHIGIGWYWVTPIAFTDTSDMWLATRKPRMLVNMAGVYVDCIVAGISAFLILLIPNPYIQAMLWLFALYTYIGGFNMLSPLAELDGYYVLMDWLEKTNLRQTSVVWLIKKFPKCIRHPALFRENWPEVIYWLACIAYLIVITILTLLIQSFVFSILGIHSKNPYLTLFIPFLVVVFSCLSIIADIRKRAED